MAFTLSETGIRYSKFLKSVMLPFNEIRSIIITEQGTSITTRTGEKYNIEYRNDTECIEGTRPYSREELDSVIERVVSTSGSYADAVIKEKLGAEYGIRIIFKEDIRWGNIYFCLTKNGDIFDIPEDCKVDTDDEVPESYDNILLFFMTEWSPVNQRGYYAVTEDVVQEDLLKSYVEEWSRSMCTEYMDYLDEET